MDCNNGVCNIEFRMSSKEVVQHLNELLANSSVVDATGDIIHSTYGEAVDIAADAVMNYNDCRNELCLKCGRYTESYKGACDGCRWQH